MSGRVPTVEQHPVTSQRLLCGIMPDRVTMTRYYLSPRRNRAWPQHGTGTRAKSRTRAGVGTYARAGAETRVKHFARDRNKGRAGARPRFRDSLRPEPGVLTGARTPTDPQQPICLAGRPTDRSVSCRRPVHHDESAANKQATVPPKQALHCTEHRPRQSADLPINSAFQYTNCAIMGAHAAIGFYTSPSPKNALSFHVSPHFAVHWLLCNKHTTQRFS